MRGWTAGELDSPDGSRPEVNETHRRNPHSYIPNRAALPTNELVIFS